MQIDAQIRRDIVNELQAASAVNATSIGVEVRAGVVILTGPVASYAEKRAVERVARRVAGVMSLSSEIDVAWYGWGPNLSSAPQDQKL